MRRLWIASFLLAWFTALPAAADYYYAVAARSKVYDLLKRLEGMANAHLPEAERLEVTPHTLRHTRLRRVAEEKDLRFAKKLSGHKSDRYIRRYTDPSDEEFEREVAELD